MRCQLAAQLLIDVLAGACTIGAGQECFAQGEQREESAGIDKDPQVSGPRNNQPRAGFEISQQGGSRPLRPVDDKVRQFCRKRSVRTAKPKQAVVVGRLWFVDPKALQNVSVVADLLIATKQFADAAADGTTRPAAGAAVRSVMIMTNGTWPMGQQIGLESATSRRELGRPRPRFRKTL
jgi:hypothetical protein